MHAAYRRNTGMGSGEATFYASFPVAPAAPAVEPAPLPSAFRSEYGAGRRPSWAVLGFIAAIHGALIFALAKLDVIQIAPRKAAPLVVELITVPPAPPLVSAEPKPEPVRPTEPRIVAPAPIVISPAPPPPVATVAAPPPAAAVVVAPAPMPAPAAPMSVADLASKMVSATPPKYPLESRRKREEGTVILSVLLALDGGVADIGIAQSSGFPRLDKAALDAVRRWRWSPTLVGGKPVSVRGLVDIPFVLKG